MKLASVRDRLAAAALTGFRSVDSSRSKAKAGKAQPGKAQVGKAQVGKRQGAMVGKMPPPPPPAPTDI